MPAQAHDRRPYAFGGALSCGVCQRRMQGHWINSAPYYRCRFPNEYALANKISHPRNVYLREDAFDAQVTDWLATALAPGRLDETIDLCVPKTSSMSCDQAIVVDQASDVSVFLDAVQVEVGRFR